MKIKISIFVITAILFSISKATIGQDQSFSFISEPGKCTAVFPSQFEEKVYEDEFSKTYTTTCGNDGMYFFVNVRVYDMDEETVKNVEAQKEELLQSTMDNFVSNMKGEILGTVKDENSGVKGRIATVAIGEKKMFYSVYIKGKIEYQVVVLETVAGSLNDKKVNGFKNSFKIF